MIDKIIEHSLFNYKDYLDFDKFIYLDNMEIPKMFEQNNIKCKINYTYLEIYFPKEILDIYVDECKNIDELYNKFISKIFHKGLTELFNNISCDCFKKLITPSDLNNYNRIKEVIINNRKYYMVKFVWKFDNVINYIVKEQKLA